MTYNNNNKPFRGVNMIHGNINKQSNIALYIVGTIFLVFGSMASIFNYPEGKTQSITGIVTGAGSCQSNKKGERTCKGEFKYFMHGKKYEGETGYATNSRWRKDETLTLIVSKDNPEDYTTLKDMMFFMIFIFVGLLLIFIPKIYAIWQRKKNRRLETNNVTPYHMQDNDCNSNYTQNDNSNSTRNPWD